MSTGQESGAVAPPIVEVVTSKGSFELELFPDVAPKHVESMLKLVRDKFYDGLHVHRVEPGFVVQTGCPHTRDNARHPRAGTGGPGYSVPAEFNERLHLRGTLGMARSQSPNSAGSQWYICLAPAPFLDGQYTVFGQVRGSGMDVVDQLRVGDRLEMLRVVEA
ncbi:MAG: peptidylprolyl isomerase [Armatimonadetes bacterium]|nr:peptidylprolyl isomerase [Armatimonadota bacterium]